MLKRAFAAFVALVLCMFTVGITSFCVEDVPVITMEDMDVEYSPDGFVPKANAGDYQSRVKYTVVDSSDGTQVDIPVKRVGRFTVHAYIEAEDGNYLASSTAALTVRKAQLFVEVLNPVVAHTAMDNPVSYTVGPEWAQEFVDISVEYKAIDDLNDSGAACKVPRAPGQYLAYFHGEVSNENVEFHGKYLIYEIAERNGSAVSVEEARKSVPSFVRANVSSITIPYSGVPQAAEYSINTACMESRLMYGKAYANGSIGAFSEEVPVEPGDYAVYCYVLNTVVGNGRLVIEKITPDIVPEDCEVSYSPNGYGPPKVGGEHSDIGLTFSAYEYIDGVAGKSVSFPLKECGSYLITACPEDTAHYVYDVVYSLFTITPVQSVISGDDAVFVADGKEKTVSVAVEPQFAEYSISYYLLKDGVSTPVKAAVEAGEYFAVVAVKGSEGVVPSTAVYGLYIAEAEKKLSAADIIGYVCLGVSLAVIAVGVTEIICAKRRKRG